MATDFKTKEALGREIEKLTDQANALKCASGRGWCPDCRACEEQDHLTRELNELRRWYHSWNWSGSDYDPEGP